MSSDSTATASPVTTASPFESEHIQRPQCCVLPKQTDARDYLGSFVSMRDGTWIKLGIAIILAGQSMVWGLAVNISEIPAFSLVYWILHGILALSAVAVILMLGLGLLREFFQSLMHLKLGIESLFMLSLLGALGGSVFATLQGTGDIYYEVIIVVLVIFSFGRKIGQVSKERALIEANRYREQFDQIIRIHPESGERETVAFCKLSDGDIFEVTPGMPIGANGVICEGFGFVKETALTGEPHPIIKRAGDCVRAGTWSVDGSFKCRAVTDDAPRLIDSILEKVETSIASTRSHRQSQAEQWIQYFVIMVSLIAAATCLFWTRVDSLSTGWLNSMSVLLIACPCALGLATPLAVWTGLWQLSSMGLVSRSSHLIDALAHTRQIFFDKTGTLTESSLSIGSITITPECPWSKAHIRQLAQRLESSIQHPIARAFQHEDPSNEPVSSPPAVEILTQQWLPGKGIEATIKGDGETHQLRLGTPAWTHAKGPVSARTSANQKRISLSLDGTVIAEIHLTEDLRPGVARLIKNLQTLGIRSTILTGDPLPQWNNIAGAAIRENLTPDEKAALVKHSADNGDTPLFVGDGINDLNAMFAANASISIHDGGASLTQSNSSAILTGNQLEPIANAIRLARRIDQTLSSNLKIAVIYNVIGISLAAAGLLHPVASVLIMIVSSLLVTFRAIRKAEAIATR